MLNVLTSLQEVIITDFIPKRIPISGNIIISIYGSNLNIGSPIHARIEIVETLCVIDQEYVSS